MCKKRNTGIWILINQQPNEHDESNLHNYINNTYYKISQQSYDSGMPFLNRLVGELPVVGYGKTFLVVEKSYYAIGYTIVTGLYNWVFDSESHNINLRCQRGLYVV